MNEDAAFVRAIRERPDDETTRLVYADWLDDRSDPRAEYLRAEAAWVALQQSDEQYRPLYRRVSQLAAQLDLEWFVAVSRMGHRARSEWSRLAPLWEPYERGPFEPLREWVVAASELTETFSRHVGREATTRRFCVPVDYLAFRIHVGGDQERQSDGWADIYSASRTAERAALGASVHGKEPSERFELWLHVANTGDMHHHFLCCDLACPRFGEVAEGEDYHPWMNGSAALSRRGDTFLQFLVSLSSPDND